MNETEFKLERAADDRWTGPRLVLLIVITLGVGLGIIGSLATMAAPY
ncbi:hypothetical protein [Vulgatibacter incomptus]|uniref:Uncharacterized protein n=1 Tax=Vulgatibacter incomptus TaxID=1391653 RepID=A0A0K1PD83_9BACT|nr:hypothetical protein [Vulgatibacter incomptus]AKU91480.1 hypothetical protein AKJ08_1867 [Vulgatibacter incomptus]